MSHALLLIPTLLFGIDKPGPKAAPPVAPLAVVKAEKFAAVLREVSQTLARDHVNEFSESDLIRAGVQHLCRFAGHKPAPREQGQLDRLQQLDDDQKTKLIQTIRQNVGDLPALREQMDLRIAINGILRMVKDPHARYVPDMDRTWMCFRDWYGVGLKVERVPGTGATRVTTPTMHGPAYKAGIRAGDEITYLRRYRRNAGTLEMPQLEPTAKLSILRIRRLLTGSSDMQIQLVVKSAANEKTRRVTLTPVPGRRESIMGYSRKPNHEWNYLVDQQRRIAYLRLSAVGNTEQIETAFQRIRALKCDALILDLRQDPGGLLYVASAVAEAVGGRRLFWNVITRREGNKRVPYVIDREPMLDKLPIVCLIDSGTASCAELIAAYLQDSNRATLIGERTKGKASIQAIMPMSNGELRYTTAVFARANGDKVDRIPIQGQKDETWGIRPDHGFEVTTTPEEKDRLLEHFDAVSVIRDDYREEKVRAEEFRDCQLRKALDHLRARKK